MWLVVGLGNPGKEYLATRHNAGARALDFFAHACGAMDWRIQKKYKSAVTECGIGAERVLLMKPQTYMNESGSAVKSACAFFKIDPAHLIVVHDDLDFPVGTAKAQFDRTSAGHNGVQDIIERLGTHAFHRVRIGIGPPRDESVVELAGDSEHDTRDYVLAPFARHELPLFETSLDNVPALIKTIITSRP